MDFDVEINGEIISFSSLLDLLRELDGSGLIITDEELIAQALGGSLEEGE